MPKILLAPVGVNHREAAPESPCLLTALVLEAALRGAGLPADVFLFFEECWPAARQRLLAQANEKQYDIIGLTFMSYNRLEAYDLLREFEKALPHCPIIVGGPHASFLYEQILREFRNVKAVAIGEGEHALVEFCRRPDHLETVPGIAWRSDSGQLLVNPPSPDARVDLNSQPLLDYALLRGYRGGIPVQTSRGCVAHCLFCSWKMMEKTLRTKSPERIVREWAVIRELFGPHRRIVVYDACYNISLNHAKAMCRALIEAGLTSHPWEGVVRAKPMDREMLALLKQAGCKRLFIGVEAGNEDIRKKIGKAVSNEDLRKAFALAHEAKMPTGAFVIVGLPGETAETVAETIAFIQALRPYYGTARAPAMALPGTGLYDLMKKRGLINDEYWLYNHPRNFGDTDICCNLPLFTAEHNVLEIMRWFDKCGHETIPFDQDLPFEQLVMNDEEYDRHYPLTSDEIQPKICHLLNSGVRGTWKGRARRLVRRIRTQMRITPTRLHPPQALAISAEIRVHRPADVYLLLFNRAAGTVLSVLWSDFKVSLSKTLGPFVYSLPGNVNHTWTIALDPAWGFHTPGRYVLSLIVCGVRESVLHRANWLAWRKISFQVC